MKKISVAIVLFCLSINVNAQEPVKENKTTNTPPSSGKAINEKGVTSVKTRGLTKKSSSAATAPAAAETTETLVPVNENVEQDKPQAEPKKEKKDPKSGTTTEKAIQQKGVSSVKTRNLKNSPKATPSKTVTTETKK